MKTSVIGSAVLAAVVSAASALAADLPSPPPPPVYNPVAGYNWTGFYLGLNGGGAWGQSDQSQVLAPSPTTGDFTVMGGLVGGTAGFNLQIDHTVFGLEGDIDWARISGSAPCRTTFTCTTESDYLATARARLGYSWVDPWLAYVTGGAAFGSIGQSFAPAVGANVGTSANKVGWTAGGGVQFGFWGPWSSNWSVKLEYLYVNLGTFNCAIACSGITGQTTRTTLTESILRTGINYRF